jgi:dethiobiotin synthetase/adenosylmethionine--8-amino-7-oxononanoate aminotransferase
MIEVVRASGDLFGGQKWEGNSYETELLKLSSRDPGSWQGLPIIFDEGEPLDSVRVEV